MSNLKIFTIVVAVSVLILPSLIMSEMDELRGKYVLLQAGNCYLDCISSLMGLDLNFEGRGRKSLEVDDCSETFLFFVTLMSASPLSESAGIKRTYTTFRSGIWDRWALFPSQDITDQIFSYFRNEIPLAGTPDVSSSHFFRFVKWHKLVYIFWAFPRQFWRKTLNCQFFALWMPPAVFRTVFLRPLDLCPYFVIEFLPRVSHDDSSVTVKQKFAMHAGSGSARLGLKLIYILISFDFTLIWFHFYLDLNWF